MAIKQGRLANCKHTYIFFLALADPTINRPKSKFLIYSTQAAVLRYRPTIFNNDRGCVRQLICSAHDRISEKVNLKVCCFESSKQKPYEARFIANSSSCTTTELFKLLTTGLTAVKNMLLSTVKRYMRDMVKIYFGLLKIQVIF